jgi:lipopolysaccharide biosynthesis glycosyltransferase
MDDDIHVAFASDEDYAPFMGVALWSLMEHYHGISKIQAHILDDAISETFRVKLRKMEKVFPPLQVHFHPLPEMLRQLPVSEKYPNPIVYARIFLPKILPELPRVLYLDSDILVLGEWELLYHLDLEGNIFAARSERGFAPLKEHNHRLHRHKNADYFNTGVLLIDLAMWETQQITEQLIALVQERGPFDFPEQDALNILIDGHYYPLAPCWNKFDYRNFYPGCREIAKIVHFVYQKPWKVFSKKLETKLSPNADHTPFRFPRRHGCYYLTHLFWKTGTRTPFAEDLRALQETAKSARPIRRPSLLHGLSFIERFVRRKIRDPIRRQFSQPT